MKKNIYEQENKDLKDQITLDCVADARNDEKRRAFTRLVNPLRSGMDSLMRQWRSKARNPRIPGFAGAHPSGFTLAETLITIAIIGVVASITIPSVVRHHIEEINRVKLQKAMNMYASVLYLVSLDNKFVDNNAGLIAIGNEDN